MTKDRIILVLTLLLTNIVFFADAYFFPGIFPGPPYFVAIIIAAYFLPARSAAVVTGYAMTLKLAADVTQKAPIWLLTLYFVALEWLATLART